MKRSERQTGLICLYGIALVVESSSASFSEKLEAVVALIPRAFRYSETATARISFDGQSFCTSSSNKDTPAYKFAEDSVF